MRSLPPPLLPVLRSQSQGRILATVLLRPDREVTQTDLARELDLPLTTVTMEVGRLAEAGVFATRKVGRATLVRANESGRLTQSLTQLIGMTYGPLPAVAAEFEALGADAVVLFGSWAARWHGIGGREPGDIDVLVLGNVSRASAYRAAQRVEQITGLEVNPVLRPLSAWEDTSDPLVDDIRRKPYVVALGHVEGINQGWTAADG